MRLKKLTVQGYKTFANKTEFIFDEGITAVVGPNGSGKSNVADAIRWVLGEQRHSELRGKRTTDMIWSGSRARPRAGMASATLTLDNSNGWLPIDYSEVEITRQAYRSGENEYYVNGNKVRLKDVRELLATSGLAHRTYTMIGQGLVDRALSLKSDERRALFEEAAGISHYKTRRAESLRRLQETQRNLERISDILSEIRPRLRSLKRQADRAENYGVVEEDLRNLLRVWYGYQWDKNKVTLRAQKEKTEVAEKKWRESRRKLAHFTEQIDDARRRMNLYRENISKKEIARESTREQLEVARREVAILTERQALVKRQLGEIEADLPDLEAQRVKAQTELQEASAELQTVQASLSAEQQVLAKFEASFQTQQAEITKAQQETAKLERNLQESRKQISQAEGQLSQLRERLEERQKESGDSAEITDGEKQIEAAATDSTALQKAIDDLREQRKAIQQERQKLMTELKQLRRDQHDAGKRSGQLNKEAAKLEARAEMLDQMRQKAVEVKGGAKVLGNLAGMLTISAELQPALEAALSNRLNTLLVPDAKNLWQLLENNPEESLLAVAADGVTAWQQPAAPKQPAVKGWATDLVKFKPADSAFVALLLNPILIVDNAEAAYDIAQSLPTGGIAVTLDGTIFHAGGLVERTAGSGPNSILAQEKAWQAAKDAIVTAQEKAVEAQSQADTMRKKMEEMGVSADKLAEDERKLIQQEQAKIQEHSQHQRDLDRVKQRIGHLKNQQSNQAQEVTRLQNRIAELETTTQTHQTNLVTVESNLGAAKVRLESLPVAEAKQQRTNQQQTITATKTIVDGRRAVSDSRRATLGQVENRLTRQQQRRESLLAQQEEINLDKATQQLNELQGRMTSLEQELLPLRSNRDKILDEIAKIESDSSVNQKEAHEQETLYTEARLALSQQENFVDNLRERIRADLGLVQLAHDEDETVQAPLPIAEIVDKLPKVDELPEGIDEAIQKRRGQLQRMGAINPDAPEEYAETLERHDFLEQQVADLNETEVQLRKVIAELDELTSQEFAATVERVNDIFGAMFTRLFGGGSAELQLTNPDDLTVSGVDILARLPGRRTQGLGLLSGGERSLTAAALIFSLLTVTPPPFCVMDEVDAALDEANVNRFREALQDLAIKSQFIVITHNRGTVQAASTIYGISMGSDSVSQVISIKPEDYVSTEPMV